MSSSTSRWFDRGHRLGPTGAEAASRSGAQVGEKEVDTVFLFDLHPGLPDGSGQCRVPRVSAASPGEARAAPPCPANAGGYGGYNPDHEFFGYRQSI